MKLEEEDSGAAARTEHRRTVRRRLMISGRRARGGEEKEEEGVESEVAAEVATKQFLLRFDECLLRAIPDARVTTTREF